MARDDFSITIYIDPHYSLIHFYSMRGNAKRSIDHQLKSCACDRLDEEFFANFKQIIGEYAKSSPSASQRKVTVILPEQAVLTDSFSVPTLKGLGQTKKALDTTLTGLYRNYNDLRIVSQIIRQNKQSTTYAVAAVKKEIISAVYAAFSESKLLVDAITFAPSATINAVSAINPKLKSESYLFLDLKDIYSRFIFVVNGVALGEYTFPFGLEYLRSGAYVPEDMLFDCSRAELAVMNAKAKVRSQQTVTAEPEPDGAMDADALAERAKLIRRKPPRELPEYMRRPIPETREDITLEHFRVFVKWALTLINDNPRLTALGMPQFVCVNIPLDIIDVLDRINEEAEENGITFSAFSYKELAVVLDNLELYGGFSPRQISEVGRL